MNRSTKQMKKHDEIESLPSDIKYKLMDALKNENLMLIVTAARDLKVYQRRLIEHITHWTINYNNNKDRFKFDEIPKDLSFTERLSLVLKLQEYEL